eukprot:TRINITY_DN15060_c0_g1_i1.p1 TRINITY_DN15060_c0_g1~~TRINITY_DN15060_c0_g1_i1.p1  ORF type:complete len:209 (+),score=34.72 TRINITY_DN15060_c0_g1_i1:41-667(+)
MNTLTSPRDFLTLVPPGDDYTELLSHSGAWETFFSGLLSPEKVENIFDNYSNYSTKQKGVIVHAFINNDDTQNTEKLLQKEEDENIRKEIVNTQFFGERPIHRAFGSQAIEILKKHGADLDAKDKNGDTAIVLAAKVADWKIVHNLVLLGAKVEEPALPEQHSSNTALAWAHLYKNEDMVKFLEEHGARNEGQEKIERRPSRSSSIST